mmetsp:Transcript_41493/g.60861  ORF Transcript_41493/g.60861 Transcript_41493/m.60861 type:complete len:100 (+) Transcript_41493:23-322(+)
MCEDERIMVKLAMKASLSQNNSIARGSEEAANLSLSQDTPIKQPPKRKRLQQSGHAATNNNLMSDLLSSDDEDSNNQVSKKKPKPKKEENNHLHFLFRR